MCQLFALSICKHYLPINGNKCTDYLSAKFSSVYCCRVFLRIERSPLRQQELAASDGRQTLSSSDVMMDDREDYDAVSLVSRNELAQDDVDDLSEIANTKPASDEAGPTVASDVSSFSAPTIVMSQVSSSSPSKSEQNSMPSPIANSPQNTLVESAAGLPNDLSASMERLPVTCSCTVVVPPSKSFESFSVHGSLTSVKSSSVSSRTEPVQATAASLGKVSSISSTSKMAAVPPLAKKGLTHLLSSSSALFHRKRQLRTDANAKSVSVSYNSSSLSLTSLQSESDSSAGLAESGTESQAKQGENIDANVVPVVCGDVTFLMVKDDLCQKPTDLSPVDKIEDNLSMSSSCKDSDYSLKTSSLPSSEMLNFTDKNDKASDDTVSIRSRQVSVTYIHSHSA